MENKFLHSKTTILIALPSILRYLLLVIKILSTLKSYHHIAIPWNNTLPVKKSFFKEQQQNAHRTLLCNKTEHLRMIIKMH